MGQLVAQHAQEARVEGVEAQHGNLDRPVVPPLGPLGGAGGVPEGGSGLQHHGDRLVGAETEPAPIFGVGLGQDLEDSHPHRLIEGSLVPYPERHFRHPRVGKGEGLALPFDLGVGLEGETPGVFLIGPPPLADRRQGVSEEGPRAGVGGVLSQGLLQALPGAARIPEGELRGS